MAASIDKKNELQKVAAKRKLVCLSKIFVTSLTKYRWQCPKCSLVWRASHNNIKRGGGCPACAQKKRAKSQIRYSIEDLYLAAKSKKGRCLSKKYLGANSKHKWQCGKGHIWESGTVLRIGTWCPYCDGQRKIDPLDELIEIANSRGGKIISKKYLNNRTALHFVCERKHKFKLVSSALKAGQWCRHCSTGIGEAAVRQVFEQLLGQPFPSVWPSWLTSPAGRKLQLDGFCETLKIAFEHQGAQHSRSIPFFETSKFSLHKRLSYDRIKRVKCKKNQVLLILIPQVPIKISFSELPDFVARELKKNDVHKFKKSPLKVSIDLSTSHSERKILALRAMAAKRGGKLLEKSYLGAFSKHKWKCSKGHVWKAIPVNLMRKNYWCPVCGLEKRAASRRRKSYLKCRQVASRNGGRFLVAEAEYAGMKTRYQWRCGFCNKRWLASPEKIIGTRRKSGSWCADCAA
jgi:hypothetical protein